MNFAAKIVKDGGAPVYLLSGNERTGRECYFLVRFPSPAKFDKMQRDAKKGAFNITDYGQILDSGFGPHPDEPARAALEEKYGIAIPAE